MAQMERGRGSGKSKGAVRRPNEEVQTMLGHRWTGAPVLRHAGEERVLNVPPDVYDLRDRTYIPRLQVLPTTIDPISSTSGQSIRIHDQGNEGACTGFALAAMIEHLLRLQQHTVTVSPRFLYENARRYDEWEGQEYEGSSIRGAMKGFLKHGACSDAVLPYNPGQRLERLPQAAYDDARDKPLGAYFRVTTSSVNDLQSALAEVGAVIASAQVHKGWAEVRNGIDGKLPVIPWEAGTLVEGGHAFALVGYNDVGFIVQNSWGRRWGAGGFGVLRYADWLSNRMDAWVGQLGVGRVEDQLPLSASANGTAAARVATVNETDIHGHYLAISNGTFDIHGAIHSFPEDVSAIAQRIKSTVPAGGTLKLLLFAHGGLVGENGAAAKTAEFKDRFLKQGVYPLHFIWHTDFWQEVGDVILGRSGQLREPVGGFLGGLTERLQNALDGTLELTARPLGKPIWGEMKRDAAVACRQPGGRGPAFQLLDAIHTSRATVEYHLVGHSAGSILLCHLLDWFAEKEVPVSTLTFWAPAVTTQLFCRTAKRLIGHRIGRFALHTMADRDERDDHCGNISRAGIYHKSLLYLVSYSFEEESTPRILGLDRHIRQDMRGSTADVEPELLGWMTDPKNCELVLRRPSLESPTATLHGSFDDDELTIQALENRILRASQG